MRIFKALQKIALCLLVLFTACFLYIGWQGKRANAEVFAEFTHLPALGSFKESYQRHFFQPNSKRVVLLVHGHASAPSDFDPLLHLLEKNQISYYAPQMVGFGLDRTDLLTELQTQDWTLQLCQIYDLLTSMGKEVSLIGYSNGAVLAANLATQRSVDQLIFVSPNFFTPTPVFLPSKLSSATLLSYITYLSPVFSYDWIRKSGSYRFGYRAVPTFNIRQMLKGQSQLDLARLKANQVYLFFSQYDHTVNSKALIAVDKLHPSWKMQEYPFEGHNLFYGHIECNKQIIQILKALETV